jgi:acyl-coenzyme A synthetase/AMP-(fatty) acid ligase
MTLSRECNGEITTHSLNDHLVFHGERRFELGGRVDSAVQVGGHNVFPEVIADCLRQHPDIAECIVRLDGEDRLKAFIVPVPSGTAARSEDDEQRLIEGLHRWCSERLKAHEVPRRFAFGASLPRNELGKIIDWSGDSTSI